MKTKSKILIIYTGGTIGMIKDVETQALINVDFNLIYDHVPELKRLNVTLDTISFDAPIDSSEINPEHWKKIALLVFENYSKFDGFVVLHGSDTMAYTASALSFMFEGLKKPIILTGAQLPIGTIRTDGKENLITAIEIASSKTADGKPLIQEVAVYFDYKLFRGNRSTKDATENFEAFRSPNYIELGTAGVELRYNQNAFFTSELDDLSLRLDLNHRVALLKLFPGMNFELYAGVFDKEKVDGVVLETFGSGNAPTSKVFKDLLSNFIKNDGIVLNITQCNSGGAKQGRYKSSSLFNKLGVVCGEDMTTEAAITKMMVFLMAENSELSKSLLKTNLRGELTII